jgi:hypothetical protein
MADTRFDCGWNDTIEGLASCDTIGWLIWFVNNMHKVTQQPTGYARGCKAAMNVVLSSGKFLDLSSVIKLKI